MEEIRRRVSGVRSRLPSIEWNRNTNQSRHSSSGTSLDAKCTLPCLTFAFLACITVIVLNVFMILGLDEIRKNFDKDVNYPGGKKGAESIKQELRIIMKIVERPVAGKHIVPERGTASPVTIPTHLVCDANWSSSDGTSCVMYEILNLCQKNGDHYGSGWKRNETFKDWADEEGRTALVCPQCGCTNTAKSNRKLRMDDLPDETIEQLKDLLQETLEGKDSFKKQLTDFEPLLKNMAAVAAKVSSGYPALIKNLNDVVEAEKTINKGFDP